MVHARMKSVWSIGKSEGHDQKLIVTIMTGESCFGDVLVPSPDLMVPRAKIDLGEVLSSLKLIHEFVNSGNGIPILNGLFVECSIVDAHS